MITSNPSAIAQYNVPHTTNSLAYMNIIHDQQNKGEQLRTYGTLIYNKMYGGRKTGGNMLECRCRGGICCQNCLHGNKCIGKSNGRIVKRRKPK